MNRFGCKKKAAVKIVSLLLAGITLLPFLTACQTEPETPPAPAQTTAPASTEGGASPSAPDDPAQVEIPVSQLKNMALVYPKDADPAVIAKVGELRDQIRQTYGVQMLAFPDDEMDPSGNGEILIGACNRPESVAFQKNIRYEDFCYAVEGNNIFITGGSKEKLLKALTEFIFNIVYMRKGGKTMFFKSDFNYSKPGTYLLDALTVNGTAIQDYTIVYPAGSSRHEDLLAKRLQYWLRDKVGYELPLQSDGKAQAGKELRVGKTNRMSGSFQATKEYEGIIAEQDDSIVLFGETASGLAQAVDSFLAQVDLLVGDSNKTAELTVSGTRVAVPDEILSVMSFNVYCVKELTSERAARVVETIMYAQPDVFGIQEGNDFWLNIFDTTISDIYRKSGVGEGRMENKDICVHPYFDSDAFGVIYYNEAKFELLEEGHKWLSSTPDVCSKFPNANWPRLVNWVVLKRKTDGKVFVYANTHLDEAGDRDKEATVLTQIVNSVSVRYDNCPTFITGDFNQQYYEDGYKNTVAGGFQDSALLAKVKVNPENTVFTPLYAELNPDANNKDLKATIDYCFSRNISKEDVLYYRVMKDEVNGNYPSDHYPVYFEFKLS